MYKILPAEDKKISKKTKRKANKKLKHAPPYRIND
jgi:hypothetical protein